MNDYDELYHFGIHGMRWGIRRYQNPDGSLTEAGKKRYLKEQYKVERAQRKIEKLQAKTDLAKAKTQEANARAELKRAKQQEVVDKELADRKIRDAKADVARLKEERKEAKRRAKYGLDSSQQARSKYEDIITSGNKRKIKKYASLLSDSEMQRAVNRMELDARLSSVNAKRRSEAFQRVGNNINTTMKTAENMVKGYNMFASVYNTFGKRNDDGSARFKTVDIGSFSSKKNKNKSTDDSN